MTVSGSGAMNRMQMQQMGGGMGMGRGQGGGNGMRDIMQQLSPDQRTELKTQMQSLSESDRQSLVNEMKQVDSSTLSSDAYYETLMSMVSAAAPQTESSSIVDLYA